MSIAEKLVTVAENQEKVYKSGLLTGASGGVAHGEVISLTDVAPGAYDIDVKLSSKNLIPFPYYESSKTANGVTFTVNDDCSITINGTPEKSTYIRLCRATFKKGKYLLSGCTGGGYNKYMLYMQTATGAELRPNFNGDTAVELTEDSERDICISTYVGNTYENLVIYPMLRKADVSDATYTPYIADFSTVKVNAYGKNFIDYNNYKVTSSGSATFNGSEITLTRVTENGNPPSIIFYLGKYENFIGKTLTLSATTVGLVNNDSAMATIMIGDVTVEGIYSTNGAIKFTTNNIGTKTSQKVTIPKVEGFDGKQLTLRLYLNRGTTVGDALIVKELQIEAGTVATSYEPYIEPTTYTPNADGVVENIEMIQPNMTLIPDTQGILMDCEYRMDAKESYVKGGLAQCPKKTISGEELYLTDISPIEHNMGVKLSSKNFLPNKFSVELPYTTNGITFADNGDGGIRVSGTSTSTASINYSGVSLSPNVTYRLVHIGGISGLNTFISYYDENNTSQLYATKSGTNFTWKDTYTFRRCFLQVDSGKTVDVVVYPMLVLSDTDYSTYTPYVDLSTTTLSALGKNIYNPTVRKTSKTDKGLTIQYLENEDCYLLNGTPTTTGAYYMLNETILVDDYISFACEVVGGSVDNPDNKYMMFYVGYKNSEDGSRNNWASITLKDGVNVAKSSQRYIGDSWFYIAGGITFNNYKVRVSVEKGVNANKYEPYIEPTSYTPNADGTVDGVSSKYINLSSDTEGVLIDCEYRQDLFEAGLINATEIAMSNSEQTGGYVMTFAGYGWCDDNYRPTRPIRHKGNYNQLYNYSRITDTKVDIDVTLSTSNRSTLFSYAQNLKTIRKIITTENHGYSNWFAACSALENITFEGIIGKNIDFKDSKKLSKASIENIVGCLSTTATGQTLTLSLTAVNNAFETSSGAADGSTSEEWINLITPKSNSYNGLWTITLV